MPARDRYALFGHPVSHSWSPFIHGLFARELGHDIEYTLVDVEPERFRRTVLEFFVDGGRGANVTLPHKQAAAEVVNELSPRAERARAVNTLISRDGVRLVGDNTDGIGLVTDLRANLRIDIAGARVLLLGAGGAVRGVLEPLVGERPALLRIANRTPERALSLAQEFSDLGQVLAGGFDSVEPQPWDIIINGTSASLAGQVPELVANAVGAGTVCYDMAYARGDTPFVTWARRHGAGLAVKGWGMLVEQAAESYLAWRGVRPPTAPVISALQAA